MKSLHHYRFYLPPQQLSHSTVRFPPEESRHIARSLRLSEGDLISATDGAGGIYELRLETVKARQVVASVVSKKNVAMPLPRIALFQGLIRPQVMDLVVEKCVELGLLDFYPLRTSRSRDGYVKKRTERWRRIAIEAMKQSLRAWLPEIRDAVTLEEALELRGELDTILVAHQQGGLNLLGVVEGLAGKRRIGILIGPEGGFDEAEIEMMKRSQVVFYNLGHTRLRSETAAITSLAILSTALGVTTG